jgi:IclR family transcriptional regulator, acetate operon repressor
VATARGSPKRNQSVRKAIVLLRAAAARGHGGASVSALARDAGLPRATALRLIQTLEDEGFLLRIPESDRVVLGPDLARLARRVDPGAMLIDLARRPLERIGAAVRETVTLSVPVPDGGLDVIHQVDGPHLLKPGTWIGRRFPLHASSSGKVLLSTYDERRLQAFLRTPLERLTPATITEPSALRAELERVRERGYATIVDELEEGLASVSIGVFAPARRLVGVVNVTGLSLRFTCAGQQRIVSELRATVAGLEDAFGRGDLPVPESLSY